jgi:hypothetical protein
MRLPSGTGLSPDARIITPWRFILNNWPRHAETDAVAADRRMDAAALRGVQGLRILIGQNIS